LAVDTLKAQAGDGVADEGGVFAGVDLEDQRRVGDNRERHSYPPGTVKNHLARMHKIRGRDRAHMAAIALRAGLLSADDH
jgi:hypothetical protein